eukprot:COSAG06_NODE_916_length_11564_cov_7.148190_6_plen_76_part_00
MDMRLSKTVANASTLDLWLSLISLSCPLLCALPTTLLLLYYSLSLCGETGRLRAGRRETNRCTCESIQMRILITV